MPSLHCIRAGVLAAAIGLPAMAAAQDSNSFTIFLRSVPIGAEQVSVTRSADGWSIVSSGRMGPPVDIVSRRVQVRYTDDWKPLEIVVDATVKGQIQGVQSNIIGTSSQTHTINGLDSSDRTDTIPADALLLPSPFWGPFEALALRLKDMPKGTTMPAYTGNGVFTLRVGDTKTERIQTAARLIDVRSTDIVMMLAGTPGVDADIWTDESGHLLRVTIPAQNVDILREDIASVAARRVTASRPNDEQTRIPANGFSLAATISKPSSSAGAGQLPAVVLIGGSGPTDRDETVFNVPIFGQLAGALADAGFLVVRYDKRGIGQSGGRAENATLADYADDVRDVVKYVRSRKDVDRRRIALVGHSEGGSVAMIAAARDHDITGLVLVDTMGVTGAELNLEQVTHGLDRANRPQADRQKTIDLQKQIQAAVLSGKGWDQIPPNLRRQADTPWFQSFLSFDPAKVMPSVRQPILIVQSMLDTQVAPSNADRLEALARARKKQAPVDVVKVPGVNHLLVPAKTGEYDEYRTLGNAHVSAEVSGAIASGLQKMFSRPQ